MGKSDEINYLRSLNHSERVYAQEKPFSAKNCGDLLIKIGFLLKFIPAPPARILDLGCGTGWTSCMLARTGYDVVGRDLSPEMIELANENRSLWNATSATFSVGDYESLNADAEFDVVLFFDCLHHAENEKQALQTAWRALTPNGLCLAHEPGVGHAADEHTKREVKRHNVTEKDMPPAHIRRLALEIGFSKIHFFPFPDELLTATLANHSGEKQTELSARGGVFRKRKYRKQLAGLFGPAYNLFTRLDENGICVLQK